MRFPKAPICLSLLALAGCEFFHPTTIPSSDTTAPYAIVSLYYDDDHQELMLGRKSLADAANKEVFNVVTTDPYEGYIALAAGLDGGGVQRVEMSSRVFARCVYGPANVTILEPWSTQVDTQSGSPGDTVDNGLYVPKSFQGYRYQSHLDFCSDGNYQVTLEFLARARDFHGNWANYGLGKVTYVQWGS